MSNRVYDYAKKFAQDTATFIKNISKMGIKDKTALNKLDETEIKIIEQNMPKILESETKKEVRTIIVQEKKIFTPAKKKNFNKDNNSNNNSDKKWSNNKNDNQKREFNKDGKFSKDNNQKKNYNNNNNKFNNKDNQNFDRKPFNKDKDKDKDKGQNQNITHARVAPAKFRAKIQEKPKAEPASLEMPEVETTTKPTKNKSKSKFDKKKYEKEKKAKEEERKLKELRTDYRKETVKKKVKKKDKTIKSEVVQMDEGAGVLKIQGELTTKELAEKIGILSSEIIKKFFMQGKMLTVNSILSLEEIEDIALEYNVLIEHEEEEEVSYGEKYELEIEDKEEDLTERAPIITIMGHVDHGKTSLLDALRHTNVIKDEAGGITQSIGAYQVNWQGQKITFIDTPGHEAFTEMRARGANITDISILIVAADDGVKPQTVEAISHAKEANVPIIVAINKIDKPSANPMRVKQELMEHGIITQEWGGDVECVEISAKEKLNLDKLLETIVITAELLELKANPKKRAKAVVVESKLDPQVGPVASILIQEGELKIGDIFVAGEAYGKVRTITDDKGKRIKKAGPSMPVEITGLNSIAEAGEIVYCVQNDKQARKIIEDYKDNKKIRELNGKKHISLESLSQELENQQLKELKCIIRADSKGSAEALKESLIKLSNDKVMVNIIQAATGAITEGDIKLAEASDAIIIGFGVRPTTTARIESEKTGVEIRNYNVIYHVTEDIEKALKGMLDPEFKEIYHGRIEVKQIFKVSNVGNVAGSIVVDGKITKNSKIRVLRNGIIVYEGEILALKRFKDDAKEVTLGQDCGISIKDFNDVKEGDIIEAYALEEIVR